MKIFRYTVFMIYIIFCGTSLIGMQKKYRKHKKVDVCGSHFFKKQQNQYLQKKNSNNQSSQYSQLKVELDKRQCSEIAQLLKSFSQNKHIKNFDQKNSSVNSKKEGNSKQIISQKAKIRGSWILKWIIFILNFYFSDSQRMVSSQERLRAYYASLNVALEINLMEKDKATFWDKYSLPSELHELIKKNGKTPEYNDMFIGQNVSYVCKGSNYSNKEQIYELVSAYHIENVINIFRYNHLAVQRQYIYQINNGKWALFDQYMPESKIFPRQRFTRSQIQQLVYLIERTGYGPHGCYEGELSNVVRIEDQMLILKQGMFGNMPLWDYKAIIKSLKDIYRCLSTNHMMSLPVKKWFRERLDLQQRLWGKVSRCGSNDAFDKIELEWNSKD